MSVKLRKVNAQIRDPDKNNQLVQFGLLGSDAVETIESAKTQAISEMETKRVTSLGSIPNDYSTLAQDVSDLKGDLDETVKFTAQTLTDSQKATARENIGIDNAGVSIIPANKDAFTGYYVSKGNLSQTIVVGKVFKEIQGIVNLDGWCYKRYPVEALKYYELLSFSIRMSIIRSNIEKEVKVPIEKLLKALNV